MAATIVSTHERATAAERILRAAVALFRERGYHGSSMRTLARALRMEAASLYYHFKSKQEILFAILDRTLEKIGWEFEAVPGIETLWVEGGPAVANCIRGFVRMAPGAEFPHHRHVGDETALVLEGAVIDSTGNVYLPGDVVHMPAGSEHGYSAR